MYGSNGIVCFLIVVYQDFVILLTSMIILVAPVINSEDFWAFMEPSCVSKG